VSSSCGLTAPSSPRRASFAFCGGRFALSGAANHSFVSHSQMFRCDNKRPFFSLMRYHGTVASTLVKFCILRETLRFFRSCVSLVRVPFTIEPRSLRYVRDSGTDSRSACTSHLQAQENLWRRSSTPREGEHCQSIIRARQLEARRSSSWCQRRREGRDNE